MENFVFDRGKRLQNYLLKRGIYAKAGEDDCARLPYHIVQPGHNRSAVLLKKHIIFDGFFEIGIIWFVLDGQKLPQRKKIGCVTASIMKRIILWQGHVPSTMSAQFIKLIFSVVPAPLINVGM